MERNTYALAESVLAETNCLISMPAVCIQLREVIADSDHTRKDIVDIISRDSALTARLLRVVNSAYYGLTYSVKDLSNALSILGEQGLSNLVMVTSIVSSAKPSPLHMDMEGYWRSSLFCAVMSRNVARYRSLAESHIEECFVSGLLLNIGKLFLYYSEPDLHGKVRMEMDATGKTDFTIEKELLGFDHADVGAVMSRSWGFPNQFSDNIANHHSENIERSSIEESIVMLAAYLSDRIDLDSPHEELSGILPTPRKDVLEKLQLSEGKYAELAGIAYEDYMLAYEAFYGGAI